MIASLFLNKYVIGFLAVAALMAGIYFAWGHYVAEPYRAEGRAEGRAEMLAKLTPAIDRASQQLDADAVAFKQIEASFKAINENSKRLKALAAHAQKVKVEVIEVEKTRVEFIERIAPSGETECLMTQDVISKALRGGP